MKTHRRLSNDYRPRIKVYSTVRTYRGYTVSLIAPGINGGDAQDSQKLGSVRLDARSGTQ
eukprot:9472822-Pyramimonas_sp.AAC.4